MAPKNQYLSVGNYTQSHPHSEGDLGYKNLLTYPPALKPIEDILVQIN